MLEYVDFSKKEWMWLFFIVFAMFILNIGREYFFYKKVFENKFFQDSATVLLQYPKKKREILKLKTKEGFVFFTSTKEKIKNLKGRDVEILFINNKKPSFFKFLKSFYAVCYIKRVLPQQKNFFKRNVVDFFTQQHISLKMKELTKALFFGISPSYEIKKSFSFLGISHLLAISGLHIGMIFGFLFYFFKILSHPLYKCFFPYRNRVRDLSVLSFMFLFVYLLCLEYSPSALRAYWMSVIGFLFFDRGIRVFSIKFLLIVVMILISFEIRLMFSLGFWFSVAGVYLIFVFLKYFNFDRFVNILLISLFLYIAMFPLVHLFFGQFSFLQFYSPLLSLIFILFYPVFLGLHFFGAGGEMDFLVEKLLSLRYEIYFVKTSFLEAAIYFILLFGAGFSKRVFYIFLFFCCIFFIYKIIQL